MKYIQSAIIVLLFVYALPFAMAQDLGDCGRMDKTIDQIIKACQSIIKAKDRTDREVAIAARRVGLILQFDNKGSPEEVIGYLLLSAKKGLSTSFSHIGEIYRTGYKTLKPDYEKALYYYRQDESISTTQLLGVGEMLLNGQGLEKSIEGAITSFQNIAYLDEDNSSIRARLCDIYNTGKYVEKDVVKAYFWCSSAVDAESFPALKGMYENRRLSLEMQLDKSQLLKANKLINECKKTSLLSCINP
jgi:TPR repeat protein